MLVETESMGKKVLIGANAYSAALIWHIIAAMTAHPHFPHKLII